MEIQLEQIQKMIDLIRGQKVMMDSDLAKVYEKERGAFNRQVKSNGELFLDDFIFLMAN